MRNPAKGLFLTLSLLLAACGAADLPEVATTAVGPLYVSTRADRSAASGLANAGLRGKTYLFAKLSGLRQVMFYLDDKTRSRPPYRADRATPFDLVGGGSSGALPFDTAKLKDGAHTLTAALTLTSGRVQVVHAPFTVRNAAPAPTPTPTPIPTPTPTPTPTPAPSDFASTLLTLVNDARRSGYDCGSRGVFAATGAVALESRLTTAAQAHAADMNANGYFSHTGQDGSSVGTRVSQSGYTWSWVGENIAMGYPDAGAVMAGWLTSDGHCANVMNPNYTHLGAGKSGSYWVQVFARPR